jgi:hypothetical protein
MQIQLKSDKNIQHFTRRPNTVDRNTKLETINLFVEKAVGR